MASCQVFRDQCAVPDVRIQQAHHPITDVFFVVTHLKKYSHVTAGPITFVLKALESFAQPAKLTSSSNHEINTGHLVQMDTRVHILTDLTHLIRSGTSLGSNFYVHNMSVFAEQTQRFFDLYQRTHATVNSVEYEFLCFNRWLLIRNVTERWNSEHTGELSMQRILALDLDVLMTMSAHEFASNVINALSPPLSPPRHLDSQPPFQVAVISLGAVQLFSARGIARFAQYTWEFFARPLLQVQEGLRPYGRFFSDMMLMKEYIVEARGNASLRNACFELWRANEYYQWREQTVNRGLLNALGCVPMSGYREMMAGNELSFFRGDHRLQGGGQDKGLRSPLSLRGSRESLPYCLVHFQSKEYKPWLFLISVLQHHLLHAALFPPPSNSTLQAISQHGASLLCLHAYRRSASLVLVGDARGVVARPLSWQLASERYGHLPAVHNVPDYLLSLLQQGEPIT
ncbi:hypothetical protein EON64_16890 [archaeon]|nr:MAG: hypothetical protein EON64_16890 [archaeon]